STRQNSRSFELLVPRMKLSIRAIFIRVSLRRTTHQCRAADRVDQGSLCGVPAEAGTHGSTVRASDGWVPAFAGTRNLGVQLGRRAAIEPVRNVASSRRMTVPAVMRWRNHRQAARLVTERS